MAELETMRIVCPKDVGRYWIINSRDFDPARHKVWGEVTMQRIALPGREGMIKDKRTKAAPKTETKRERRASAPSQTQVQLSLVDYCPKAGSESDESSHTAGAE